MRVHVVPGQVRWRWCHRCRTWSALEVGVYALPDDGPPDLIGTFEGCTGCDPDLFAPGLDLPPDGGTDTDGGPPMTNPTPNPDPDPRPDDDERTGF